MRIDDGHVCSRWLREGLGTDLRDFDPELFITFECAAHLRNPLHLLPGLDAESLGLAAAGMNQHPDRIAGHHLPVRSVNTKVLVQALDPSACGRQNCLPGRLSRRILHIILAAAVHTGAMRRAIANPDRHPGVSGHWLAQVDTEHMRRRAFNDPGVADDLDLVRVKGAIIIEDRSDAACTRAVA